MKLTPFFEFTEACVCYRMPPSTDDDGTPLAGAMSPDAQCPEHGDEAMPEWWDETRQRVLRLIEDREDVA